MSKCMIKNDGTMVRVSKEEAQQLYDTGVAAYLSKDEFRRIKELSRGESEKLKSKLMRERLILEGI